MFKVYQLSFDTNPFDELESCIEYEKVVGDRKGTVIVKKKDNRIPIVRTTTKYEKPTQEFKPIHHEIVKKIREVSGLDIDFNNGLCEVYGQGYRKMGEHSDQALDLEKDSYIAVFSCYNEPTIEVRTLKVKEKDGKRKYSFEMKHCSVILFSVKENSKHLHKIILEKISSKTTTKWAGVTFRLSKQYIEFKDGIPFMTNGKRLIIANDKETKEFYKMRGKENKEVDYEYPECNYTISKSDLVEI